MCWCEKFIIIISSCISDQKHSKNRNTGIYIVYFNKNKLDLVAKLHMFTIFNDPLKKYSSLLIG